MQLSVKAGSAIKFMTKSSAIISLADWLQTPAGRYLLAWEQQHLDLAVVDVFGFHALQLGLPELDALRANRMPHRWLCGDGSHPIQPAADEALPRVAVALHSDFDALPFDSDRWLARYEWTEPLGDRWWPVFGAVYSLTAVKRVRGMRLVGLARKERLKAKAAPAVVAQHHHHHHHHHRNEPDGS